MINLKYATSLIIFLVFMYALFSVYLMTNPTNKELRIAMTEESEFRLVLQSPKPAIGEYSIHKKSKYKIMLWTTLWRSNWLRNIRDKLLRDKEYGRTQYDNCEYDNCVLTDDRRQLNSSDAVVFHLGSNELNDIPGYHLKNQSWILFTLEAPLYWWIGPQEARLVNDINWVMSYQEDAEIFSPSGVIKKCASKWKPKKHLFGAKTKAIAWMVTRCQSWGKRELYVNELRKYIDVDVSGKCGTYQCQPKFGATCYKTLERKYKFYLAFENSLCKDYVTEKLFYTIQYDIIPIVYGSANYSRIMPPNSYIDIANFTSPKKLAEYLNEVAADESKYYSYFEWKRSYCSVDITFDFSYTNICRVCKKLNAAANYANGFGIKTDLIESLDNKTVCRHDVEFRFDLNEKLNVNYSDLI